MSLFCAELKKEEGKESGVRRGREGGGGGDGGGGG